MWLRTRLRSLKEREAHAWIVVNLVQPGTSAILVIVRKVTPDKFLEALRPYGGTVLCTSLSHDAEQRLMKALHGDDPKAPTWQQEESPV